MQITIKVLQAEYRDGFVFTKIGAPAAAVLPVDVRNVAELDAEVKALRAALVVVELFPGLHDAGRDGMAVVTRPDRGSGRRPA